MEGRKEALEVCISGVGCGGLLQEELKKIV
jgi:hypothetical protein